MSERRYTVKEIDALRAAVERRYLFGTTHMKPGVTYSSFSHGERELSAVVEARVRTYMQAGVTAEEIYASDRPKIEA